MALKELETSAWVGFEFPKEYASGHLAASIQSLRLFGVPQPIGNAWTIFQCVGGWT
jgi:hypothetical protein